MALCSHKGKLYDGDNEAVYETLSNKRVAERNNWVWTLCSDNYMLYDGGHYNAVYKTLTGKLVRKFSKPIITMISVEREVVGL